MYKNDLDISEILKTNVDPEVAKIDMLQANVEYYNQLLIIAADEWAACLVEYRETQDYAYGFLQKRVEAEKKLLHAVQRYNKAAVEWVSALAQDD